VSTHSYVGVRDPEQPGLVQLRYVHSDGCPSHLVPTLRMIWAGAAAGDTHRLVTSLLAHDWDYLTLETTVGGDSPLFAGAQLIPGVGVTLAASNGDGQVLPPEPVTVVALTATGDLDAQWIYLLDLGTVHTSGGGDIVGREQLAS
jgi:hypothetical protein